MRTVAYSYGTISESMHFDDHDEAQAFYDMMLERVHVYASEFGDDSEYEPSIAMYDENGEEVK